MLPNYCVSFNDTDIFCFKAQWRGIPEFVTFTISFGLVFVTCLLTMFADKKALDWKQESELNEKIPLINWDEKRLIEIDENDSEDQPVELNNEVSCMCLG